MIRIAGGVLLLLLAVLNVRGALDHAAAADVTAEAGPLVALAISLWFLVGLQLAAAITLFTNNAKALGLGVVGLSLLAELISGLLVGPGPFTVPIVVAAGLALVGAAKVRAGPAGAGPKLRAHENRRAWVQASAAVAGVGVAAAMGFGVLGANLGSEAIAAPRPLVAPTAGTSPGTALPAVPSPVAPPPSVAPPSRGEACEPRMVLDPDPQETGANLRTAPKGDLLFEIPNCTAVCVTASEGSWRHVRLSSGQRGVVHARLLAQPGAERCREANRRTQGSALAND